MGRKASIFPTVFRRRATTERTYPRADKPPTSLASLNDRLAPGKAKFVHFNSQGSREDETIRPKLVRRSLEEIRRSKPSPLKRQAELLASLKEKPRLNSASQMMHGEAHVTSARSRKRAWVDRSLKCSHHLACTRMHALASESISLSETMEQ